MRVRINHGLLMRQPKLLKEQEMNSLKTVSVGLAMLLGAGALAVSPASASPIVGLNQIEQPSSKLELVHMKKWKYDRKRHGLRKRGRDRDHRFSFDGFWYTAPFWTFGLAAPYYGDRFYDDGFYGDRVSCREARRLVDRRYRKVRTLDCSGRYYEFRAMNKRGRAFTVRVDSRTGELLRSKVL